MLTLLKEKHTCIIKTVMFLAALAAIAVTVFWLVCRLSDKKD